MGPLLIGLAVSFALLLAAIVARMAEKRLVWPYVAADEGSTRATSYLTKTATAAEALGFLRLGVFRDGKGRIYKIRYELWCAPHGEALLLMGGGSVGGIPLDGSWVFTRLVNGRCILSIDNEAGREHDPTGLIEETVYPKRSLDALLAWHREAVARAATPALPYADAVAEHRDLLNRRIRALVDGGHAAFSGAGQERWRYTAKGAVVATFSGYWRGLWEALRGLTRRSP